MKNKLHALGFCLSWLLGLWSNTALGDALPLILEVETKNAVASPLPGVVVSVNGKKLGVSDSLGRLPLRLPLGEYRLEGYIPGAYRSEPLDLKLTSQEKPVQVELLLNQPDLSLEWSALRHSSVIAEKFKSSFLEIRDRARRVLPILELESLELINERTGRRRDLRDYWILRKGRLHSTEEANLALSEIFSEIEDIAKLEIRVRIKGFERERIGTERYFLVGRNTLRINLRSGSSGVPGELTNIQLRYRPLIPHPEGILRFSVTTDTQGVAMLDNLPFGWYELERISGQLDERWSWRWSIRLDRPMEVSLQPETWQEIAKGNKPVQSKLGKIKPKWLAWMQGAERDEVK